MNLFLRLKHWQLFILVMGPIAIFQIVSFSSIMASGTPDTIFTIFPLMMAIFLSLFFGWFYALGVNLFQKLPEDSSMNLPRFKLFVIIPLIYMLFICFFIAGIFNNSGIQATVNPGIIFIILPVHLFSMFCMFYCLYFIAKSLKSVELQKEVTVSDYLGDFFLIWFFPIGIWVIQPRVNKIFDDSDR